MITYAVIRPDRDHWQDPIRVLVYETHQRDKAERFAEQHLSDWPELILEEWMDSYTDVVDGKRVWRKSQKTTTLKTYGAEHASPV